MVNEKNLRARIRERCRMRLKRRLGRKPRPEELEKCILDELYREEHGLVEKRGGRPTNEEEMIDLMRKRLEQKREDKAFEAERERAFQKELAEDVSILRRINKGLDESDEEPSREEQLKELSKRINEQLEEQCSRGICPRCKSSVCRCEQE